MTTKNFLLFQAGKQGCFGRTIPEELFKPENFGKVLTLRGADDVPYLGAEDLPKLFVADFGRTPFLDVKNAYDSGAVVVCYHNDVLYQLSSFNGFKIEFARVTKDIDDKIFYTTTTVTENGWVSSDIELSADGIPEAPSDDRPYVRKNGDWEAYAPQFTFGDDVDVGEFAEAVASNKTLVYVTSVTHPVSHTRSNKQFNLSGTEQRAGRPDMTLYFERIEGAVLSKVSIVWDTVAETLTFGDVEDYDIGSEKLSDAPSDDKTYARKNGGWEEVGGDAATFVAVYNSTSFADIQSAISEGKCVKCDVSGYTYELVQALSNKITFALTNNVDGTITQETVWVTSDDEWDGEAVNLAKVSSVPTKTSELENDSGFIKPPEGEGESGTGFVMTSIGWTETFVALYGIITTDMSGADILSVITTRQLVMLYDMSDEDHVEKYNFTGYALDLTTYDFILNFVGSTGTATARISFLDDSIRWEFKNSVKSTDITSIVKVSAMPENPDPNTLYLVVEEEPTTASEVE